MSELRASMRGVMRDLQRGVYAWLSPHRWRRRLVFWGGAVLVGVAAAVFAIGAEVAIAEFELLVRTSRWLPLVATPLGLALVVYLTRRFLPGAAGSGIPQTIAALQVHDTGVRGGLLSLRMAFGKIVLTLLALLSGASVGREGPTVQVGASIMQALGRFARFPSHEIERGLIVAGGAAGVAAAFNTPLAGIVFAIEELARSFEHRTNGTILAAVIFAGMTAIALLGDYTYFGTTGASLAGFTAWSAVLVCGIACGLAGGLFARILIATSSALPGRLGVWRSTRPVRFAAGCGLAVAVIGLLADGSTYGTGYYQAKQLLEGADHVPDSFGLLKLVATVVSYLSGAPGGIFAPSLAVGAGLGANIASLLDYAPVGAVVVLGMVAYFAGVAQAPLTAFIIVMEMTANHDLVIPLMAAALIGNGAARLVCPEPLYKALASGLVARLPQPGPVALPAPVDAGVAAAKDPR